MNNRTRLAAAIVGAASLWLATPAFALKYAAPEHAMKVGRQLRTGVTFFNNHNATAVDERAPFGGFAQSGIGRELGSEGMHDFTETHVMAVPVPSEDGSH